MQEHETDTSDLIKFVHDGFSMHVVAVQRSKNREYVNMADAGRQGQGQSRIDIEGRGGTKFLGNILQKYHLPHCLHWWSCWCR